MYPYFVCARRHRVHDCTFKAVLIDEVEELVAALYQRIQLTTEDRAKVECYLQGELAQIEGEKDREVRSLTTRRTNIEDKRRRRATRPLRRCCATGLAQGRTGPADGRAGAY